MKQDIFYKSRAYGLIFLWFIYAVHFVIDPDSEALKWSDPNSYKSCIQKQFSNPGIIINVDKDPVQDQDPDKVFGPDHMVMHLLHKDISA